MQHLLLPMRFYNEQSLSVVSSSACPSLSTVSIIEKYLSCVLHLAGSTSNTCGCLLPSAGWRYEYLHHNLYCLHHFLGVHSIFKPTWWFKVPWLEHQGDQFYFSIHVPSLLGMGNSVYICSLAYRDFTSSCLVCNISVLSFLCNMCCCIYL